MPFAEDFTAFTNTAEFGEVGLYTPAGSVVSSAVNGIFDAEYDGALGMEGSAPAFSCALADVPGVTHGAAIVVNDTEYVVKGVQPDGTGWVVLILELP